MPKRVCNPDLAKYGKYVLTNATVETELDSWQPIIELDHWQHLFIKWVQMVSWYEGHWFCFVLKRGKCISLTPYVGGHSQPFQGTDGIFRLHKISLAPRVPLRFYPVKPCTISCTLFKMWCTFWFSKFIPQKILSTACVGWLERYRILPNKILAHNNDNDIADPEYLYFLFEQTFGILLLVIRFLNRE